MVADNPKSSSISTVDDQDNVRIMGALSSTNNQNHPTTWRVVTAIVIMVSIAVIISTIITVTCAFNKDGKRPQICVTQFCSSKQDDVEKKEVDSKHQSTEKDHFRTERETTLSSNSTPSDLLKHSLEGSIQKIENLWNVVSPNRTPCVSLNLQDHGRSCPSSDSKSESRYSLESQTPPIHFLRSFSSKDSTPISTVKKRNVTMKKTSSVSRKTLPFSYKDPAPLEDQISPLNISVEDETETS
ncbi:uncharacterized protein LOC122802457 [Protopterus annectens]|uniref:uncharacterized protein LOC122802457 n=1 Tax=Protopterus annectens TaxID=7888 RepID=UPI001CFA9C7D|nr:uncharacterized protein LOC122802457 [Protopterus annectens]